jgi:TPP-dependent pyruvate/acetoin dehydrogenase alpha subunit
LEHEVKEVAEMAADFASKSPYPEAKEAFTDIFA